MDRHLLVLLAGVALLTAADWRTFMAPGALSRAHDGFAGDCDACHMTFAGIPDERCLACHTAIAEREQAGRGYHASVSEQACIACHTDHKGLDAEQTREAASEAFDHASTGFGLGGRHAALDCASCHPGPLSEVAPTCGGCHEDPHGSALGPDCAACHVDAGWTSQLKTLAAHQIDTTGGHQGLDCVDCHLHGEQLRLDVPCAECHEQGHGGTLAPCDQCHQVSGFKPAAFDHGPCTCAFPGKHQTVECLACHPDFSFVDTPTLCGGCHGTDRPHEDLGECARCHTALSWSEGRFDHDTSKFRLIGAHLAVSCDMCHAASFRGVPTACAGCHAEQGHVAHGDFGACEPCHTPGGFSPSSFDHASTGFPLTGRHSGAPCQSCHASRVQGYPGPPGQPAPSNGP